MNENVKEELIKQRNLYYYNQMIQNSTSAAITKKVSFGSQKVELRDFLFVPEQLEAVFYTLYGLFIPYVTGVIFLFFFVAGGSFENFKLLNMDAFLIIWLIGYEIVASLALMWIMILYLRYDSQEVYY